MKSIQVGMVIEWVTSYPGHEGQLVQGRVYYAGCSLYPSNLHVGAPFGTVEVARSQVVRVVEGA